MIVSKMAASELVISLSKGGRDACPDTDSIGIEVPCGQRPTGLAAADVYIVIHYRYTEDKYK